MSSAMSNGPGVFYERRRKHGSAALKNCSSIFSIILSSMPLSKTSHFYTSLLVVASSPRLGGISPALVKMSRLRRWTWVCFDHTNTAVEGLTLGRGGLGTGVGWGDMGASTLFCLSRQEKPKGHETQGGKGMCHHLLGFDLGCQWVRGTRGQAWHNSGTFAPASWQSKQCKHKQDRFT